MFQFEKLDVWRKTIEYTDRIYTGTRSFPSDERIGLTSQMRRSAVSISSNIAEGSSRSSKADFSRFVEIGYGSLLVTVSQSYVAKRQKFLVQTAFDDIYGRAAELARMLSGLKNSLQRSSSC